MPRAKPKQQILPYRNLGGPRKGAGRKPKGKKAMVSHMARAPLGRSYPVHVTTKLLRGLPNLRTRPTYAVLREQFRKGCERFGFRLIHYSIQRDHLHLICEAKDRRAMSRGMQGLTIRIAKALNRFWQRRGKVFADHYHDVILRSPRQVRNALAYVFHNAKKHGHRLSLPLDFFSSACWFDGWRERPEIAGKPCHDPPTAEGRTWLLNKGWRKSRLLSVFEAPALAPP